MWFSSSQLGAGPAHCVAYVDIRARSGDPMTLADMNEAAAAADAFACG